MKGCDDGNTKYLERISFISIINTVSISSLNGFFLHKKYKTTNNLKTHDAIL